MRPPRGVVAGEPEIVLEGSTKPHRTLGEASPKKRKGLAPGLHCARMVPGKPPGRWDTPALSRPHVAGLTLANAGLTLSALLVPANCPKRWKQSAFSPFWVLFL